MKLGDIHSRRLLIAKAVLFAVLGLIAAALVIVETNPWREGIFLIFAVWAFCRLYYFLFYVIEKYINADHRYSGIWNALVFLSKKNPSKSDPS